MAKKPAKSKTPAFTIAEFGKVLKKEYSNLKSHTDVEKISMGVPYLDRVNSGSVTVGGIMMGGVIEVSGKESSGKTTYALTVVRSVLRSIPKHEGIIFFDYEHSVDKTYALSCFGVNLYDEDPRVQYLQPYSVDEARQVLSSLFSAAEKNNYCPVRLLVFDSVAAMNPKKQAAAALSGEEVKQPALRAAELSDLLASYVGLCEKYRCMVLFTNQLRDNIQLGYGGSNEKDFTPGGRALRFHCWVRVALDPKKKFKVKEYEPTTGKFEERELFNLVRVRNIKNKIAPPFVWDEVYIRYGYGFDFTYTTMEKARALGLYNPTAKRNMAALDRSRSFYIEGSGSAGWHVYKYELAEGEGDEEENFFFAVDEKGNPKRESILYAKNRDDLCALLTHPDKREVWDYLISEVARHYKRGEKLYMTPEERAKLLIESTGDVSIDEEDTEEIIVSQEQLDETLEDIQGTLVVGDSIITPEGEVLAELVDEEETD